MITMTTNWIIFIILIIVTMFIYGAGFGYSIHMPTLIFSSIIWTISNILDALTKNSYND